MIRYTSKGHVLVSLDTAVVEDDEMLHAVVYLLSAPSPPTSLAKAFASLKTRARRYGLEVTRTDAGLRFSRECNRVRVEANGRRAPGRLV